MTKENLTAKQECFVREYLVDRNAAQAAIRAGYSVKNAEKTGRALLRKSRVMALIDRAMDKRAAQAGPDQDSVISKLLKVAELSIDAGQYSPANRALELLGKHIGMFREKVDATVTANIEHSAGPEVIALIRKIAGGGRV